MKIREFNKILKTVSHTKGKSKGFLDVEKIKLLPIETKREMAMFIIRNRKQVLVEFVDGVFTEKPFDMNWLYSMGYLYKTTGKSGYTFYHTSENLIQ